MFGLLQLVVFLLLVSPALGAVVSDSFDRVDGSLGDRWAGPLFPGGQPLRIFDETVSIPGTGSGAALREESFGASQYVEATLTDSDGEQTQAYFFLCVSGANSAQASGYFLETRNLMDETNRLRVKRLVNGVATTIGSNIAQEFQPGDRFKLTYNAATRTLEVFLKRPGDNFVSLGTRTDNTLSCANTTVGLGVNSFAMGLDDFVGGDYDGSSSGGSSSGGSSGDDGSRVEGTSTGGYGHTREGCTTSGILVPVGTNLEHLIEAGKAGNTFLLRGGTHALASGHISFPKGSATQPVTLKPYNCENVMVRLQGYTLQPNDYTILAGLQLVTATGSLQGIHVRSMDADPIQGVIIRNNTISGPATGSQIRLVGNVRDMVISNNDIAHIASGSVTLRLINNAAYVPDNIRIVQNRFRNCGEDCLQPELTGTLIVEDNAFEGPARENIIDIKGLRKDSFLRRNALYCTGSNAACVLIQEQSTAGAEGFVEANRFLGCPRSTSLQVRVTRGGKSGTYHFRKNTFDLDDSSCLALDVNTCYSCDFSHNTFYHGTLKIGADGWPKNVTINNNIFYKTAFNDRTNGSPYTCSRNGMYNTTDRLHNSCTGTVTSDPQFVDPNRGDFRVRNVAYLGTATDGGNIGAW